jgi:hypothetical protein
MKKIFIAITLISIASVLVINIAQSQSINQKNSSKPAAIKDALLQQAWVYLARQTDAIQLWDGHSLSGSQLAQMVLDDHIRVVWDTQNVCQGYNCSPRSICAATQCPAKDYPIYMGLYTRDVGANNIASLAALLGHEIFHHSQPFGKVADSQFEEYWAYFIQSHLENSAWKNEVQKDTFNPVCLHQWFVDHRMTHYFAYNPYPASVTAQVQSSADTCLSPYSN